ncbi:MAG TPA: flagellar hook protein FlgE [Nitrospiraceae bacterium]|nr:flagellar hook protein FlgE [Nitrospiraceae bacterium]
MGILTSLFSAVSGLNTYGNAMSVIGNNIANVGTAGFKSSRASFADLVSASLGGGSSTGQVGLGVFLNDVQTSFVQGSLSNTGNTLDLAIDGNGFFNLRDAAGTVSYSRAGQFKVNNLGEIVDPSGRFLQGYQASATGIILGTVGNITLSTATIAPQATSTAAVEANLNAASTVPATVFDATDATTYNFSNGMTIYDSLGAQHQLRMYYVKAAANTWNLHSQIDGGATTAQTNLVFNSSGVLTGGGAQTFSLPITGGAATPLSVAMDFSKITQYGAASSLTNQTQDGFTSGSFQSLSIDSVGQVVAQFSNGQTRTLSQIVLSRFTNPDGLARSGENGFAETIDSGAALDGAPTNNGLGRLLSQTIEQSNVDLGKEFVDMIITQRAFQANSKTITTSDEMLQELVNLKR